MPVARARATPPVSGRRAARMAAWQWAIGLSVTLLLAVWGWFDWFSRSSYAEYPFLDLRTKLFTHFKPPPSDEVALVAIDDQALDTVGKWPWPRDRLAKVIRELDRAGAKVIALDLLLDDPESPRLVGDPSRPGTIRPADGDAELAEAIKAHGGVVLGASFQIRDETAAARERRRVEAVRAESDAEAGGAGGEARAGAATKADYREVFLFVSENPDATFEEAKSKFLTADEAATTSGAAVDDLRVKFDWAKILQDRQYDFSIPGASSAIRVPMSDDPEPPAPRLLASAAQLASVSFGREDLDGAVRRVPLWIRSGARLYPTLGLAAAARQLGAKISEARIEGSYTILPLPGGATIPLLMHRAPLRRLGDVEGLYFVTWPRGGLDGWQSQFLVERDKVIPRDDRAPEATRSASAAGPLIPREIAIGRIIDPYLVFDRIAENIAGLDRSMIAVGRAYGFLDPAAYEQRAAAMTRLTPDDAEWRTLLERQKADWLAAAKNASELLPTFPPEAELSAEERAQLADLRALAATVPDLIRRIDEGLAGVTRWREKELRRRVEGKIVLIGWTATGALADFVQTSVDSRTPGMHVHAAVMNSILLRSQLQIGTPYLRVLDLVSVLAVGVFATLIGVRFSVLLGPPALLAAIGGWALVNGVLFWDRAMLVVASATPYAAGILSWLAVILHRLLVEQRGRRQTEARFRSYVSPDVVDILVNNPGLSTMAPQKRELTMMFSDIAGFTTISERLGTEQLAAVLNTYLGAMTTILQKHKGTIDKYLGDGIMVFWGAPVADAEHARHAVLAAVEMMDRLDEMNAAGAFGPAGKLGVRVGLATGEVNVGDFGNPPHKSAYTVIGDAVNLAARLESANKFFGTQILITDRTKQLAGDSFRTRLIGRIVVKGKSEYQTIHELIGTRNPRGPATEGWIRLTEQAVEAYIRGDFEGSLAAFAQLEREYADSVLTGVYRRSIESILRVGGVPDGFAGAIVLEEK